MLTFLKSLFKNGSSQTANNEQQTFELFKFDGMRAQRIGQRDYAIKCFNKALEIEQDFETMGYLSQLYLEIGEPAEAKHWLELMHAQEPLLASPLLALAHVEFLQGNTVGMEAWAQQAVEIEPNNEQTYFLWGKALGQNEKYAEAVDCLSQAIVLKPEFEEAHLLKAKFLLELSHMDEALSHLNEVLKRNAEDESALLLYAHYLKKDGSRAEEIERVYQNLTELNPFNLQAHHEWGQLLVKQERYSEAVSQLTEALELLPQSEELYVLRGEARKAIGDQEGAELDMQEAERVRKTREESSSVISSNQSQHTGNVFVGLS